MIEWDETPAPHERPAPLPSSPPSAAPSRPMPIDDEAFADACARYILLASEMEAAKEKLEAQKHVVIAGMSDDETEPGEYTRIVGDLQATLTVGERWSWDQDQLALLTGIESAKATNALPKKIVDVKFTVPRRTYETLSPDLLAQFEKALTISPGVKKLDVVRGA